jgi:hypothetical protein
MSRDVSAAFIAACNAAETSEGFYVLITIDADELPDSIRLNNSGTTFVSRGNTFYAFPIQVTLSDDSEDSPPQAKLIIDNIDRTMVAAMRSISTPCTVMLEVVKHSDLNTPEAVLTDFQIREVTYNALTIEGTLSLEALFSEPAVAYDFTPTYFPGLF